MLNTTLKRLSGLTCCHALLSGLAISGAGSVGLAAGPSDIELHAFDGSAVVKGELLEVSDGSYIVKTALGTLRIGLEEADCLGDGCPNVDRFDADFTIYSDTADIKVSMLDMLAGYADQLGADFRIDGTDDGRDEFTVVDRVSGASLTTIALRAAGAELEAESSDLAIVTEPHRAAFQEGRDELLLALEGIAMIVHPGSQIAGLSPRAIASLFACDGAERVIGGTYFGGAPRVYSRSTETDAFKTFKALVLDPYGAELCPEAVLLSSDADIASAVAKDPRGIGFVDITRASDSRTVPVSACGLTHEPTLFNAKSGDYPLAQRVFLEAPPLAESSGAAQRFIDFALSDGGQAYLEETGLVGLGLDSTEGDVMYRLMRIEAAARVAQRVNVVEAFVNQTVDAARLSATFRFSAGSSNANEAFGLDNRAQRDLTRMVHYLNTEAPAETEVLVLGFADSSGDYSRNLVLSQQRAQSVADKLAAFGVSISVVAGFGEEAPTACNNEAAGRAKNRRVEIWLRVPERQEAGRTVRITM